MFLTTKVSRDLNLESVKLGYIKYKKWLFNIRVLCFICKKNIFKQLVNDCR